MRSDIKMICNLSRLRLSKWSLRITRKSRVTRQNIAIYLDLNLISIPNVTHSSRKQTVLFKLTFLFYHCEIPNENCCHFEFTKCVPLRLWKGLSATHSCCKMTITYCLMTIVVYFMPTPCWYITIGNTREYMHVAKWQLHFALFYLFQNNYVFLASLCLFFYQLVSY